MEDMEDAIILAAALHRASRIVRQLRRHVLWALLWLLLVLHSLNLRHQMKMYKGRSWPRVPGP